MAFDPSGCAAPVIECRRIDTPCGPRSGERIYRLESIKREERNAELFKVPADFALKASPTRATDGK